MHGVDFIKDLAVIMLTAGVRYQRDNQNGDNTPAETYLNSEIGNNNGLSRAPDFASFLLRSDSTALPTTTTVSLQGLSATSLAVAPLARLIAVGRWY